MYQLWRRVSFSEGLCAGMVVICVGGENGNGGDKVGGHDDMLIWRVLPSPISEIGNNGVLNGWWVSIFSHLLRSNCFDIIFTYLCLTIWFVWSTRFGSRSWWCCFVDCLLIMSQPAICCRWRVGVAATEKDQKIAMKNCWELVFQYRKRIRGCWRRVFQHYGWIMCWMMVFQQRDEAIAGRNCFVDAGGEKDDGKG